MDSQYLKRKKMPDSPGVYIFRDRNRRPLYIGRATSLKDRVKSYFSPELIEARGPRIVDMVTKARAISWQETDSVLEAIILESKLIKRYQPHYNVDERDDKSDQYVVVTDEPWPRVFLARVRDFDAMEKEGRLPYKVGKLFGPYIHSGLIKEALRILRKMFPFRDKKSLDPRHEAFYRALGRSPDGSDDGARLRYMRTIDRLVMFFDGRKDDLRSDLERGMNESAARMDFEEAERQKKLLYAIDHINDIALIKEEKRGTKKGEPGFRIEAYDVAHLSGTNVVGSMAVSVDGEAAKDQYRKFKISRQANNDTAGLAEILSRRLNHPEWPFPDLIAVDGNEIQMRAAENVLRARRISIPIVAVTKDDRHKAADVIGDKAMAEKHEKAIISANAEAHRFAISFHRHRRSKSLI